MGENNGDSTTPRRRFYPGVPVYRCPHCDEPIETANINIREGFALCVGCGELSRLSELHESARSASEVLGDPPSRCSIVDMGNTVVVTASLRSIGTAVGCIAVALFWNGIVSIFVLLAIAGLYTNLIGPLPDWLPAPGVKNGRPMMNDAPMGLGETVGLCVFLIPFVAIGSLMIGAVLLSLFGKVQVVIDEFDSYVGTGVGFVLWKRRFDPRSVSAVKFGLSSWETNDQRQPQIELTADRSIKFGSLLSEKRREWMQGVLREIFLRPNGRQAGSNLPQLTWLTRTS
jgi:hypothetical protein